jgi:alginate O-acetyltransferase complex protein AlgI
LIGGVIYQPYYVGTVALAALVTWRAPQTWDWSRRLTAPRVAIATAAFALAALALTTQAYNPFIYFIF